MIITLSAIYIEANNDIQNTENSSNFPDKIKIPMRQSVIIDSQIKNEKDMLGIPNGI